VNLFLRASALDRIYLLLVHSFLPTLLLLLKGCLQTGDALVLLRCYDSNPFRQVLLRSCHLCRGRFKFGAEACFRPSSEDGAHCQPFLAPEHHHQHLLRTLLLDVITGSSGNLQLLFRLDEILLQLSLRGHSLC